MTTILKTLVGSRAYGLATPFSDYDYKGVYIAPTSKLLSLGGNIKTGSQSIDGKVDDVQWEVGKFLSLAIQCNPTALELFFAPIVAATTEGLALRELFPYVWQPTRVYNAFVGYSSSQRNEYIKGRGPKYAVAYIRTLYQATVLLSEGYLPIDMTGTELYSRLRAIKTGFPSIIADEVLVLCGEWKKEVDTVYDMHMNGAYGPVQAPNIDAVNNYLLSVRHNNW